MRGRKYYAIEKGNKLLGFLVKEIDSDSEIPTHIVPISEEHEEILLYFYKSMENLEKEGFSEEKVVPIVEKDDIVIVNYIMHKQPVYYLIILYNPLSSYYVSYECEQIAHIINEGKVDFYFSKEQAVKSLERKEKLVSTYKDKCEQKILLEISKDVKLK
ncbi:MAG: hypothetical protein RQ930_03565 [Candidatus Aenigmarchaeota archaeon]|jgi:hypothetical protein|nr:hypothetical protein [Candidatus Aenigmarchaeota archaeon]